MDREYGRNRRFVLAMASYGRLWLCEHPKVSIIHSVVALALVLNSLPSGKPSTNNGI